MRISFLCRAGSLVIYLPVMYLLVFMDWFYNKIYFLLHWLCDVGLSYTWALLILDCIEFSLQELHWTLSMFLLLSLLTWVCCCLLPLLVPRYCWRKVDLDDAAFF